MKENPYNSIPQDNYNYSDSYTYGYKNNYEYRTGGYDNESDDFKPKQGLKDYLAILREKIWYFLLTLLIVFSASIIYCFKATPLYDSVAIIHVLRDDDSILGIKNIESNDIKSAQDLNTQIKIIESAKIINNVAERLKGNDLKKFMAPYEERSQLFGPISIHKLLMDNRKIIPIRGSLMVSIKYSHPDPEIAALTANLFANEYINYKVKLNVENSMKAVDDLKVRVDQQRLKVENLEAKMAEYRETHSGISLENQSDIDHQELSAINNALTVARNLYDIAKTRWELIQQSLKNNTNLTHLSFISEMEPIKLLLVALSNKNIEISTLEKRYRSKHPNMVATVKAKQETEQELKNAISSAVNIITAEYQEAKNNYDKISNRLLEKEYEIIRLSKIRVEYSSIVRDFEVNQSLYQSLVMRMNTELAQINLSKPNARIIDRAVASLSPASPNIFIIIPMGLLGGILAGIILVILVTHLDDRTKSAFDVEASIGMPLIGIVPRIKINNSSEKAKFVARNSDRFVTESFRSIHSILRLNPISKHAQVILSTSTAPSEGKTFLITNLASMFSSHNEKCLIIDADLRMPSLSTLFNKNNDKGIIQYCEGDLDFDDIVIPDEETQLDLILSGGKYTNPTQLLTSKKFKNIIAQAKERYDRIFIDTPPLGAVSDVLSLLENADGLIYVIKFNAISRKAIKKHYRKILDSEVPVLGGIMNQVSISMANYYYSTYYNRTYNRYYGNEQPIVDIKEKERETLLT